MLKKLIPVIFALIGLGVGLGAGVFLRPHEDPAAEAATEKVEDGPEELVEYVKLNNQFVVPVVEEGRVSALVILSISLEVAPASTEAVFAKEPKIRDALLQVLFDHANAGGFKGVFTDGANLIFLREAMREAAIKVMGDLVRDVLISDLVRQDS